MIYTHNGHNQFVNQCFAYFSYLLGRFADEHKSAIIATNRYFADRSVFKMKFIPGINFILKNCAALGREMHPEPPRTHLGFVTPRGQIKTCTRNHF